MIYSKNWASQMDVPTNTFKNHICCLLPMPAVLPYVILYIPPVHTVSNGSIRSSTEHNFLGHWVVQNDMTCTNCVTTEILIQSTVCCLPPMKEFPFHVFVSFPPVHTTIQWAWGCWIMQLGGCDILTKKYSLLFT